MNPKILNRDFKHPVDGWYQIEPKGEHPNRPAKVIQVIDEEAITQIVNRFNADAAAGELAHGHEMLIDHEHFKHDTTKESIAYGWLQQLENRADGIYAKIRWTATGKPAVDGGSYRFFSTEYDAADLTVLNSATPKRVRPVRLAGLTLTNDPNNKGGKPITNRQEPNFPGAGASGAHQNQNQRTTTMKSIAQKLGLAPEASEEAILGEVTKLQNRLTTLEPLAAENTTLKNRIKDVETSAIAAEVAGLLAERKITDAKIVNRIQPVLAGLANREERIAFLDDCGFQAGAQATTTPKRVLNRADGKGGNPETTATTDEQTLAAKITNRANELQAGGMKFERAWNQARTEVTSAK